MFQVLPPPAPIALLVRAPVVFALSYREVAACHEVPLRGPRGSTKVRFEPGLRCAYRLRLPAGQRVDINIDIYHVNETANDTSPLNHSPSSAPSFLVNGNSATAYSVPDANLTSKLLDDTDTTLVANFPYESSDDALYINGDSLQTSSDSLLTEESIGESLEDALDDSDRGGLASAIESLEVSSTYIFYNIIFLHFLSLILKNPGPQVSSTRNTTSNYSPSTFYVKRVDTGLKALNLLSVTFI